MIAHSHSSRPCVVLEQPRNPATKERSYGKWFRTAFRLFAHLLQFLLWRLPSQVKGQSQCHIWKDLTGTKMKEQLLCDCHLDGRDTALRTHWDLRLSITARQVCSKYIYWNATLPPIIMEVENGSSNIGFLSFGGDFLVPSLWEKG